MKITVIGRTEILYDTARLLQEDGNEIKCILTAKEAPEYIRKSADFQNLAEEWSIPFATGAKIVDYYDLLADSGADIAVSMNYPGIFPQSIIDLFPLGVLNAHGGDLPRYRGNACQAWAILNGEKRIGLCVHKMVGGELDSGDIIVRDYLPININTKVTEVWHWMAGRTPELMFEAVNQLEKNPSYILERQSTDPTKALRCYPRKPEDGRIDWNKPAIDVLRLINACNKPYAGAFCYLEGEKIIIWDAQLVEDDENFCAVPGQVTKIDDAFVEVACGSGKLRVLEAEVDGRSDSPRNWIQSIRKRLS